MNNKSVLWIILKFLSVLLLFICPVTYGQMSKFPQVHGSTDSVLIDVNRFKLPINNIGGLADQLIGDQSIAGGIYDGNIVMFSGGFYLSGLSNGFLWANGNFSSERISDYVPGTVGTIPQD